MADINKWMKIRFLPPSSGCKWIQWAKQILEYDQRKKSGVSLACDLATRDSGQLLLYHRKIALPFSGWLEWKPMRSENRVLGHWTGPPWIQVSIQNRCLGHLASASLPQEITRKSKWLPWRPGTNKAALKQVFVSHVLHEIQSLCNVLPPEPHW